MKPLLLLVEDDPIETRRIEAALHLSGYDTIHAADGDAALAALERARAGTRPFDAVLLDLVLPGLDGMGLLGIMAARGIRVPVVVAVTAGGIDAAASAIRAGARDFVVKPAGALRLKVALANAIALAATGERGAIADAAVAPMEARRSALCGTDARVGDAVTGLSLRATSVPPSPGTFIDRGGHVRPLEEIEEKAIRFACAHYGGRLTEVARRLGIGRSTLYRKLARIGLLTGDGTMPVHHPESHPAHTVAAE